MTVESFLVIKKLVGLLAGLLLAIPCLGGVLAASQINLIRIAGPVQTELQLASDLVADILPPPEYVIEPFLEATALLREPRQYPQRAKRLADLQQEYEARHVYWASSNLEPALRQSIAEGAHGPAQRFWAELNERFLPAAKANDIRAMKDSYARLSADYTVQRAMVEKTVALAATHAASLKARSDWQLAWAIGLLATIGVIVIASVVAAYLGLMRRVVQPLAEIAGATTILAGGGNATVPHLTRSDELGHMAKAIEKFRMAAVERAERDARSGVEQQLVTTALGDGLIALREGNLTSFIHAEFPLGYAALRSSFNEALHKLSALIRSITEGAANIRTGSYEIAQASEDLARRTEGNAASLEETSAALAQIDIRLRATALSTSQTVTRADQAIATVGGGRATADEAVAAMGRVSDSAKGIDSVIEGLDKIAFQTRVLAMNAAVEAGRAGDAGRGFAVVADLVSALAMRAEEEAKRARHQLTLTQTDIVTAVRAVQKVDGALANISGDVAEVHKLLGTMADDAVAQSSTISQITVAISAMDQSTQQNAAMVEETSAAARNLTTEVTSLSEQTGMFQTEEAIPARRALHARIAEYG